MNQIKPAPKLDPDREKDRKVATALGYINIEVRETNYTWKPELVGADPLGVKDFKQQPMILTIPNFTTDIAAAMKAGSRAGIKSLTWVNNGVAIVRWGEGEKDVAVGKNEMEAICNAIVAKHEAAADQNKGDKNATAKN